MEIILHFFFWLFNSVDPFYKWFLVCCILCTFHIVIKIKQKCIYAKKSVVAIKMSPSFLFSLNSPWCEVTEVKGQPNSKLGLSLDYYSSFQASTQLGISVFLQTLTLSVSPSFADFLVTQNRTDFVLQARSCTNVRHDRPQMSILGRKATAVYVELKPEEIMWSFTLFIGADDSAKQQRISAPISFLLYQCPE